MYLTKSILNRLLEEMESNNAEYINVEIFETTEKNELLVNYDIKKYKNGALTKRGYFTEEY